MTKFRFNIKKVQQLCEDMYYMQNLYQNTTDNLFTEVINSKNIWFDPASDTFNRRVQSDEANLKEALDSINSYYRNINDFSDSLSDIFLSAGVNRGIINYDTPYISLSKDKMNLINRYLNNAITSLGTYVPSGFSKKYDISEISKNVSIINSKISEINNKINVIEKDVENLISVHRTKERAIEFINIDSNVTRFNWTVVPITRKTNPKIIRVVTYDKVSNATDIQSNNLNMQTATNYNINSSNVIDGGIKTIDNNQYSKDYTVMSDAVVDTELKDYNNKQYSNDYIVNSDNVKTESDNRQMQVASDMSLSIGPVDSESSDTAMKVASDMSLSIGAIDTSANNNIMQSSSNVNLTTNTIDSNLKESGVIKSDTDINVNTNSVNSNISKTDNQTIDKVSISNGSVDTKHLNVNMQNINNGDVNVSSVSGNTVSTNMQAINSINVNTGSVGAGVSSTNMVSGNTSNFNINSVESGTVKTNDIKKAISNDTAIDEIRSEVKSNINLQKGNDDIF